MIFFLSIIGSLFSFRRPDDMSVVDTLSFNGCCESIVNTNSERFNPQRMIKRRNFFEFLAIRVSYITFRTYTSISECCVDYESELHSDHIPGKLK